MMKKLILLLMIVCLFVGSASAADLRFRGSGTWNQLATQDPCTLEWSGTGWQSAAMPGLADNDTARANWGDATVTLAFAAPAFRRIQLGVDEGGTFHIQNGGTMSVGSTAAGSSIGNNGGTGVLGILLIDAGGVFDNSNWTMVGNGATGQMTVSGTANLTGGSGHLWMGTQSGITGTIDINSGGVINVGNMLGLGTVNATSASGGTGILNVNDGGRLNLTNIHGGILDETGETYSIQAGSMLNLYGSGIVTLPGDFEAVIAEYAAEGLISGDGTPGNVATDLTTNVGFTTVFVPEPATMILLGLGGMLLRRKK